MSQAAGWYPDPAGSGRQRYFDGVQWTESYAQTYTTVYAAPTPVDTTPKPAGWYPDPRGGKQRRYWDGAQWTEHLTEPEVVGGTAKPTGAYIVSGMFAIIGVLPLLGGLGAGGEPVADRAIMILIGVVMIGGAVPIWFAFQARERRLQRQREQDRARALAIQAEIQDAAFIQGDDLRGMYGQFPPPPEVLDENR